MEINLRAKENVIILDLRGTLDVNAALFIEAVGQCLREGYSDILCNFEEVGLIDYMGISALVIAYKEVSNRGGRLKLANVAMQYRNLFAVAGVDKVIEQFPSEELALLSFKEEKAIEDIRRMQLRRRCRRLPVDIKITVRRKFSREPVCEDAEMINVSGVGMYVFGCHKFTLGDEVSLSFSLPPRNEPLEIDATVVWLADKQVQPHLYPGIGVSFKGITPQLQESLIEYVERNASCLPNEE
jgi:anti-anti-sigma factor